MAGMMDKAYKKCHRCKEWHWTDDKCAPLYYFKHSSWGDEFQEIRAHSFEDAAEEFAKLYNEDGDYSLMNSNEYVIVSDGKTEKEFNVFAEPDIHYSINEIKCD